MPLPWKKNRVTRLSQIVADLQSPKRGGSLVVETGFPTSLIDLFVKNRSRFTRPKSKKPVQPQISDAPLTPPTISLAPPPMSETSSSGDFVVVRADAPSLTRLVTVNVGGDDSGLAGSLPEVNGVGECGCGWGSKWVLAAFLKALFVVVVLITILMKLTVGMTVSAFALLFLEYAGKRFVSCLRTCYMGITIEPLTKTVSNCVWFQMLKLKKKKDCEGSDSELAIAEGDSNVVSELVVGAGCSSSSLYFDEIEVVESETKSEIDACCEETCFVVDPELDCVDRDKKLGCPKMVEEGSDGNVADSCEISQCDSKGSRSVRFKSKMVKKLVPKKLRTSMKEKREKKGRESEAESPSSGKEDDISPSFEMVGEQGDVGKDREENGNGSALLPKIKPECLREDEVDHGIITCCQESSVARVEEAAVSSENSRIHRVGNSGYVMLFVIALAGLVVGRLPSLILTMTWCFVLKIVTTQGQPPNVPRSTKILMVT